MENIDKILVANIKKRMRQVGMNQRQLALKAGIDPVGLNRILTGKKRAGPKSLAKIALQLTCKVEDFYSNASSPESIDLKAEAIGEVQILIEAYKQADEKNQKAALRVLSGNVSTIGDDDLVASMDIVRTAPKVRLYIANFVMTGDQIWLKKYREFVAMYAGDLEIQEEMKRLGKLLVVQTQK